MSFAGKIVYLVLFPGALTLLLTGAAARLVLGAVSAAARAPRDVRPPGLLSIYSSFAGEPRGEAVFAGAVVWAAPPARLFAVSWVACIVSGFLEGDLVLVYFLLLLALAARLAASHAAGVVERGPDATAEYGALVGCAAALGLALAVVALRTGEVEFSRVLNWQVQNGSLIAHTGDGALALAGSALGLAGALIAGLGLMRLGPFHVQGRAGAHGDAPVRLAGPPLAVLEASDVAMLAVVPLLITALFFAGGAGTWYQVAFWALKVLGVLVVSGAVGAACARLKGSHALAVLPGVGCALALAGLIMVWTGASL